MSLAGWFERRTGRPLIECNVLLPRLGLQSDVTLLVDTGADRTMLAPMEIALLGLDPFLLTNPQSLFGVGGLVDAHRESAIISFTDASAVYEYRLDILVVAQDRSGSSLYSLLGRDILNRWHMTYRPTENRLEFDVVSADDQLDL